MDFNNNYERIKKSILMAKELGSKLRVGPELEICGYDCMDHFLELDTITLCWQVLAKILDSDLTNDIICELGLPVLFKNSRYNCRIFCLNKKILLIRPKIILAEGGCFNENRYFVGWGYDNIQIMEEYSLDENIRKITGQEKVPFGVAIIQTDDLSIGSEVCVESLTPFKISNLYLLEGVDIITNGCGWVFRPNNLKSVMETIVGNYVTNSGIYVFSNYNGSGGGNYIYEGSSFINYCGKFVASTSYLGFNEVEVANAKINLDELRTRRSNFPARNVQQNEKMYKIERIPVKFRMIDEIGSESIPIEIPLYKIDIQNQNILAVARYLWDNLKRSKCKGYFIELTDDINSILLCICLKTMCKELIKLLKGNENEREIILNHLNHICNNTVFENESDISRNIIFSVNYGKSKIVNKLAEYLNSNHKNLQMNLQMKSELEGDKHMINRLSRLKMIENYDYAEKNSLIVISKINADIGNYKEYTKYGELYGDISPLAGLSDKDILNSIQCSIIGSEICELIKNINLKEVDNMNNFSNIIFNKKGGIFTIENKNVDKSLYNKFLSNISKFINMSNLFHSSTFSPRFNFRPLSSVSFEDAKLK